VWEETFGLVVIESMAAGVPAIAPAHASFPDFIRSGVDGLLVAPDHAPALAEAMAMLLAHPERSLALGVEARRTYEERYRPETVTAQLVGHYTDAVRRRAGATIDQPSPPAAPVATDTGEPTLRSGRERRPDPLSQ
jgi:glycosyltransferase involved in cell wall biosynthesis